MFFIAKTTVFIDHRMSELTIEKSLSESNLFKMFVSDWLLSIKLKVLLACQLQLIYKGHYRDSGISIAELILACTCHLLYSIEQSAHSLAYAVSALISINLLLTGFNYLDP